MFKPLYASTLKPREVDNTYLTDAKKLYSYEILVTRFTPSPAPSPIPL
jgi:hypothetical protein